MNKLNKILLLGSALMLSLASASMAAFTSVKKQYLDARTVTGGTKTVTFALNIKNTADNSVANPQQIRWPSYDPANLGPVTWKISTQMLQIDSTITDLLGGIQLVTDNTEANANPKWFDATPQTSSDTNSNPAGLVLATGTASNYTLPMAWSIKDSTKSIENQVLPATSSIGAADPNTGPAGAVYNNRFQWLFVADKKSPAIDLNGSGILGNGTANDPDRNAFGLDSTAFVDGQEYSRIIDDRGIHFAQAKADGSPAFGGGTGKKTSYVYFEADFATALPQSAYATNRLLVEAFTE